MFGFTIFIKGQMFYIMLKSLKGETRDDFAKRAFSMAAESFRTKNELPSSYTILFDRRAVSARGVIRPLPSHCTGE